MKSFWLVCFVSVLFMITITGCSGDPASPDRLDSEAEKWNSERKKLEEKLAQSELEKSNYRREMEAMKAGSDVGSQESPVADSNLSAAAAEKQKVEAFLTQWFRTSIQDRRSLVVNCPEFDALCDRYHTNAVDVDATFSNARIIEGPIPSYLTVTGGKTVYFGEQADTGRYYLKRVDDTFLLDWSATLGVNETAFLAWDAKKRYKG
jgi:hypothetical protein